MNLQHVNVKLYIEGSEPVDLAAVVPVFHRWIQDQDGEELLIDVADYRHVFAGPGVVLVGHEANYSVDNGDNRLGICYNRKAILGGTNQDRLRQALRAALLACLRLESDPALDGKIRYNRRDLELTINDRLVAPNTPETFTAIKPQLEILSQTLFAGDAHSLVHNSDPRRLFSVQLSSVKPFGPDQLLKNISS